MKGPERDRDTEGRFRTSRDRLSFNSAGIFGFSRSPAGRYTNGTSARFFGETRTGAFD